MRLEADVIVCGGGPAGLVTAALVARGGLRTIVFEEHEEIGVPTHCAGILGWRCWDALPYKPMEAIVERAREISFVFPNSILNLTLKKPAVIVNRAVFDAALAERAASYGVSIINKAKVIGGRGFRGGVKVSVKLRDGVVFARGKYLVAADGARSTIRRALGESMSFDIGVQSVYSRGDCERLEVYFTKPLPPGYFGWRIPFGEAEKVGAVVPLYKGKLFWKFLDKILAAKKNMLYTEGGLIPRKLVERMTRGKVALVGDSAGQVKPISRGGVFWGTIGAMELAAAITRGESLKAYERRWKRMFLQELKIGLALRGVLESLSWNQFEKILSIAGKCLKHHPIEAELDRQASFIIESIKTCLPHVARDVEAAACLIRALSLAVMSGVLA